MSRKGPGNISMQGRNDRLIQERIHDPYTSLSRLHEPAVCTGCGAVYHAGRWQWAEPRPKPANEEICPACQRINDNMPAGFLSLSGDFFELHRDEIVKLVNHLVASQSAEHPLKRIMDIEDRNGGGVMITFTDTHLPHGVGQAIQHAYKGELEIQYPRAVEVVRAAWVRQQ